MSQSLHSLYTMAEASTGANSAPFGAADRLSSARVLAITGERCLVQDETGTREAARAISCLIQPQAEDEVLVVASGRRVFILAVLTRAGLGDATLSLPDRAASLAIAAPSIALSATARLGLEAPEVAVTSRRFHLVADVLTQISRLASVVGDALTTVVGRQSTVAQRIEVTSQERNTAIAGIDSERIGTHLSQTELTTVSAAVETHLARDDIRLDAKRVTIG
ncbi:MULTISPECIES: DUF3540 domain-containing protein [unclassified Bosea (in: a-proteobacteria)]|uniref:DUF3540 domain-containing protein n=1 Tax=unclassified Bosea (in: a-proteobacteria) TaxID=2653178 RepID=UPI000F7E47DA|nr:MULTISPECIES: DUF3540 domain-containing protein [unclassified Bosea (in: a-proteobacteria)]RXT20257.1 hypothetical protein B5U98_20000 [Bosea sp. Tri-39]RXT37129.1 hypothetical protein B5U99_14315 [Bosea sp. Tri-54]